MELICAIDLLEGGAVRLRQGDYDRLAADAGDPLRLARGFVSAGCRRLHIVDLAGARAGRPVQATLVGQIASAAREEVAGVRVEAGGGLRRVEDVDALLDAGADEVILGTAAVDRPGFLAECAAVHPGRIVASIDLRSGRTALDGWTRTVADDPLALARRLLVDGASRLILTDADRDGTLGGPNLALLGRFRAALPDATLVAAGGVASADDLRALEAAGIDGAVVGLALLTGALDVATALAAIGR